MTEDEKRELRKIYRQLRREFNFIKSLFPPEWDVYEVDIMADEDSPYLTTGESILCVDVRKDGG